MKRLLLLAMTTFMVGCTTNTPAPHIPPFTFYDKQKDKDGYYKYASYWYKGKLKDGLPHGKGVCRSLYMVSKDNSEWLDGNCEFNEGKRVDALHQKRLEKSLVFTNLKRQADLNEQEQLEQARERRRQQEIQQRQANQQMWANAAIQGMTTLNQSLQQSQIEQQNFENRIAQTIQSAQQQRARELERQQSIQQQGSVQQTYSSNSSSSNASNSSSQMSAEQQSAQSRLEQQKRQLELKEKQLAEQKKRAEEQRKKELEIKQKEELKKAEELRKKQEVNDYRAAVKAGTRVSAISCGSQKNSARIVGVLGKATRPKHIYNDCSLTQVRYRCPSEVGWKYVTRNNWVLNNACIGIGDDVTVSVNCPAEKLIVEKAGFSCDKW